MLDLQSQALAAPEPLTGVDDVNGDYPGYWSPLSVIRVMHKVVIDTVSYVSPVEFSRMTGWPVTVFFPVEEQEPEVDLFDYTPPLTAEGRIYLTVREAELPELDWEL